MRNMNLLAVAAAATLAGPALAMQPAQTINGNSAPRLGWDPRKIFGGGKKPSAKVRRDPSRLQLRGYKEIPCEAPRGYFWKKDQEGPRYRLYKAP